ncbi:MAG: hypothetical protein IJ960_05595 [Oscillospiraceae bacterium]|nr:hypothetical protein [Oscillospiraceae bacterium]
MDRDEILEKSRKENRNMDEREQQIARQASIAAKVSGMTACLLVSIVAKCLGCPQYLFFALWTVYWGMNLGEFWYRAIRLKKRNDLLAAIVNTVACILCGLCFVESFHWGI